MSGSGFAVEVSLVAGRKVFSGHQNQRPSAAAMEGVMNDRTINVSTSRPNPMVAPSCPTTRRSLMSIDAMVKAKTMPARGNDSARSTHAPDDSGVEARADFFFEPGHDQ